MPPRSKKITSKLLAKTIRQSPPTLQPQQVPEEEEEEPKVSADLNEMADSSNGKLDGAENVQPEDVGDSKPVVESVRDVAVDDCSEPAKETRDDADDSSSSSSSSSDEEAEGARVANDSGEVEETEEVVIKVVL
ncbi:uncharacterized protein LOC125480918 [Pyrus x bretschneideri]|uniref:uncharacterized protein LOC125480918 n=1 Tax=Pyrus x bretschneideri TaxID=225117 RepID=UPI00202DC4CC|nr:uncharacterized protein LOC125480918 [Pyrus x bretschneideri]